MLDDIGWGRRSFLSLLISVREVFDDLHFRIPDSELVLGALSFAFSFKISEQAADSAIFTAAMRLWMVWTFR